MNFCKSWISADRILNPHLVLVIFNHVVKESTLPHQDKKTKKCYKPSTHLFYNVNPGTGVLKKQERVHIVYKDL